MKHSIPLPRLKISQDQRYLVTEDNQPFFWLGDTAWEMVHRLNKEEVLLYLEDRKAKGFNVIQTVLLAELDGLDTPNAYGHKPLIDHDPTQPNGEYFQLVDEIIQLAGKLGIYIALLPTWGTSSIRPGAKVLRSLTRKMPENMGNIWANATLYILTSSG